MGEISKAWYRICMQSSNKFVMVKMEVAQICLPFYHLHCSIQGLKTKVPYQNADRIMAWLEQGERYMQGLQAVPFASSKALMEAPASMTTSRSKVASKAAKHKDSKRKAKWLCSLPCLAA